MSINQPKIINASSVEETPEFRNMPEVEGFQRAGTRLAVVQLAAAEQAAAGIWECTPGVFRREISKREFSHFTKGRCTFIPDNGEPLELRAGDAVYWPADCLGTWHVHEALRKTFIILD